MTSEIATPRPGQKGYKPTPEQIQKMREGRARSQAERKAGKKAPRRPAAPRPPRAQSAPIRGGGLIAEKTRRKVISLVERLVGVVDSGAGWALKRSEKPVYRVDAATQEIMRDTEGRPIIEGRVRAFSDEQIAEDRLQDWERGWLAAELTDELLRYKTIRGWLLKMVEFEDRSSLPMCVAMLAAPRMLNHGMIPQEFGKMVVEMREAARKAHRGAKPAPLAEPEPEPLAPATPEETPGSVAAD